jgi:hypothetical protein
VFGQQIRDGALARAETAGQPHVHRGEATPGPSA